MGRIADVRAAAPRPPADVADASQAVPVPGAGCSRSRPFGCSRPAQCAGAARVRLGEPDVTQGCSRSPRAWTLALMPIPRGPRTPARHLAGGGTMSTAMANQCGGERVERHRFRATRAGHAGHARQSAVPRGGAGTHAQTGHEVLPTDVSEFAPVAGLGPPR